MKISYAEGHTMLFMEPETEEETWMLEILRRERAVLVNEAVVLHDGEVQKLPFKVYVRK